MPRKKPNIIVTGTPGVGKTTLCESLTLSTNLKHLAINGIVKERNFHHGWDEQLKSWIVDEDKVRAGLLHCGGELIGTVASGCN